MEKTGRRDGRDGETVRSRGGRVALGEITNLVARDRRKPCVVKRVAVNRTRVTRKQDDGPRLTVRQGGKRGPARKEGSGADESMQIEQASSTTEYSECAEVHPRALKSGDIKMTERNGVSPDKDTPADDPERTVSCDGRSKSYQPTRESRNTRSALANDLSQYDHEIYEYLLLLERRCPLKADHLKDRRITGKMRQVVIDWLLEVQNHFKLRQESVELTVAILDRCLATDPGVNQENVQLVCLAAIFVATKYHEIFMLELSDLRYICDYSFKECEILNMERRVLKMLDFKLNYALMTDFLGIYMRPLPKSLTARRLVGYLTDLSISEYALASVEPSKLACACLYITFTVLAVDITQRAVSELPTYSLPEVRQLVLIIVAKAISVIGAEEGGVYNKHLTDTNPGCLKDIIGNESYVRTLKQIYTDLQ